MFRRWAEGTLQSVLGTILIALIPGTVVTYLGHIKSAWTLPILLGMSAVALAALIVLAVDAVRRLPPKRVIPTTKNIETCVRDWLNNCLCSVQKSPSEMAHFQYLVTLHSGIKVLIGRPKRDLEDYLQIRADIRPSKDDLEKFARLTQLEQAVVVGNLRLELSRRRIGYRNLSIPADDGHLIKLIPIRETLTEYEFISAVDEVEAATTSVSIVFGLEYVKTGKFPGE